MKVGDKIKVKPCLEGGAHGPAMATVVYIHPQRRYFTAEFVIGARRARESFPLPHRDKQ